MNLFKFQMENININIHLDIMHLINISKEIVVKPEKELIIINFIFISFLIVVTIFWQLDNWTDWCSLGLFY